MENDIEPSTGQDDHGDSPASSHGFSRLARMQILVAACFLGVLTAVIGLMVWTAFGNRGQLPPLTVEDFNQARQRWQANAPLDYDVTIEVAGRQAAVYHVEVRAGEVVVSTRNAMPLKQRRTRGTWSVPGMFNTMQSDVDNAEQHRLGTAAAGVPHVHLLALFDPRFGYPQRYHRTELRKWANNDVVSWEVTQFDVVSAEKPAVPVASNKSSH
jgi:hypothetical protein